MNKRVYTGEKDVLLFSPPARIKKRDKISCACKYDDQRREYRYYIFLPEKQDETSYTLHEVTQNTYYKILDQSDSI